MKYREFTVIPVNQGIKLVKGNQEKAVKVTDCAEFRYKLTKNKIYAAGGPDGIVVWMKKNTELFDCMINKILNYAWNEMKEMREKK